MGKWRGDVGGSWGHEPGPGDVWLVRFLPSYFDSGTSRLGFEFYAPYLRQPMIAVGFYRSVA
jgi:hypothetical protein